MQELESVGNKWKGETNDAVIVFVQFKPGKNVVKISDFLISTLHLLTL